MLVTMQKATLQLQNILDNAEMIFSPYSLVDANIESLTVKPGGHYSGDVDSAAWWTIK